MSDEMLVEPRASVFRSFQSCRQPARRRRYLQPGQGVGAVRILPLPGALVRPLVRRTGPDSDAVCEG